LTETLYIQNNNITGKISEDFCTLLQNATTEYILQADCAGEQMEAKIDCPCCTECFSPFSFFEHFGKCYGVALKIQINEEKSNEFEQYWTLKDSLESIILKDGPYTTNSPPKSTYILCVARTGCYSMYATGELEFEIFENETSTYYHYSLLTQDANITFGYSSPSNSLQKDECDDIKEFEEIVIILSEYN